MSHRTHVCIIGAGPAGASAAYFLARAGARVTLVDRANFPRDKTCGDFCSLRSILMLERMGIDLDSDFNSADATTPAQTIRAIQMISPGGVRVTTSAEHTVFGGLPRVVARYALDHAIVNAAIQAGVEFRPGLRAVGIEQNTELGLKQNTKQDNATVRVTFTTNTNATTSTESIEADFVIACDGANSPTRRWLGQPEFATRHSAFAVRRYVSGLRLKAPDTIQIYYLRELLPFYGWVFPAGPGRANIGVGLPADRLRGPLNQHSATSHACGLREHLERFSKHPLVMDACEVPPDQTGPIHGHPLPFASGLRPTNSQLTVGRVLFAGDAAGLIHPLSGEGIDFALESGELAANAILETMQSEDASAAFAGYTRRCRERIVQPCERAYYGRFFLKHPRWLDRYFRGVLLADQRAAGAGITAAAQLAGALL